MFRLVSLNLNGIRSAAAKGFEAWAEGVGADCMGVQEVKAQADTIEGRFETVAGMKGRFHFAAKKGYSGVGLYSRRKPTSVRLGFGDPEFDSEGRYVESRFDRAGRKGLPKLSIVSCYFPSGSSGEHRQQAKYRFLDLMAPYLERLGQEREVILVGDINIAHKEIDLKNWKGNRKNSGFLPEERAWMTRLFEELGFVDVFRTLNPHPEQYTWWSNRGQARAKNVGWRLDYHLATPAVASLARGEHIYLEQRFSDHAPLVIDYDFTPVTMDLKTTEIETAPNPTASIVILHGLGADGNDFVPIARELDLRAAGPVRFVFPDAPTRPVTVNGGYVMRAWYDIFGFDAPQMREDDAGLRVSQALVEAVIAKEKARGIPARRIVLAGFSQGCAMTLMTGLRHDERLAGLVGLSGYLPLAAKSEAERHAASHGVPVFLAHGTQDPVIPIARARASRDALAAMGHPMEWHEYAMAHSVCAEEIADLNRWLLGVLA